MCKHLLIIILNICLNFVYYITILLVVNGLFRTILIFKKKTFHIYKNYTFYFGKYITTYYLLMCRILQFFNMLFFFLMRKYTVNQGVQIAESLFQTHSRSSFGEDGESDRKLWTGWWVGNRKNWQETSTVVPVFILLNYQLPLQVVVYI